MISGRSPNHLRAISERSPKRQINHSECIANFLTNSIFPPLSRHLPLPLSLSLCFSPPQTMAATKRNPGLTSAVPRASLNDEELVSVFWQLLAGRSCLIYGKLIVFLFSFPFLFLFPRKCRKCTSTRKRYKRSSTRSPAPLRTTSNCGRPPRRPTAMSAAVW